VFLSIVSPYFIITEQHRKNPNSDPAIQSLFFRLVGTLILGGVCGKTYQKVSLNAAFSSSTF
jgi:hypothetical protein